MVMLHRGGLEVSKLPPTLLFICFFHPPILMFALFLLYSCRLLVVYNDFAAASGHLPVIKMAAPERIGKRDACTNSNMPTVQNPNSA